MANFDLDYEGSVVQDILDTGKSLEDDGYIFLGTATPSTIPGTPTERVAYIGGPGTYNNFGTTVVVPSGSIVVITYSGSAWSKTVINHSADGYVYAGIATAETNPGTPTGKVFYFATAAGTYTNFGSLVVTQGINILKYNGTAWSQEQLIGIDDEPTDESNNLVNSGSIYNFTKNGLGVLGSETLPEKPSGKNLFNKEKVISGYLNFYGKITELNTACISAYIEVEEQENYSINYGFSSSAWHNVYDENFLYIGHIRSDNTSFQIPENGKYIRLSVNASGIDILQFEKGITSTSYEPYMSMLPDYVKLQNVTLNDIADYTAESITLKFPNFTVWDSLASGVTKNGSVYTFATSAIGNTYIGFKFGSIYDKISGFAGKKIRLTIKFKVAGGYEKLTTDNLQSYPAMVLSDMSNDKTTDVWSFSGIFEVPSSTNNSQIYARFSMSGAVSAATVELLGCYVSVLDDSVNDGDDLFEEVIKLEKELNKEMFVDYTTNYLYAFSKSGTDTATEFYGLKSISKALNSITDNAKGNRYIIIVDGIFHFTNPLDMDSEGGGEYSVAYLKPYVSLQGTGVDKSVIFVDIPSNATYHEDKTWSDYQPIYIECGGECNVSNMTVLGKNCRYTIHLERHLDDNYPVIRNIKDCKVVHYGFEGIVNTGFGHAFGTGMGIRHQWNIENCYIESTTASFAMHSTLGYPTLLQGKVNFKNCKFAKASIVASMYPQDSESYMNFVDCSFEKGLGVTATMNYRVAMYEFGNYATTKMNFGNPALPLYNNATRGKVLMITAVNDGDSISIPNTCSAFPLIISDIVDDSVYVDASGQKVKSGMHYRDGATGFKGFLYAYLDIDDNEATGGRSLATRLGNRVGSTKLLTVNIGSTEKNVFFTEDYSEKDNDYVLGKINSVLSGYAVASIICPAEYFYPLFDGEELLMNDESTPILKGMGVVLTENGVRKALSSDGRIDGIAIDDFGAGQQGRVITKGQIYSYHKRGTSYPITTLEVDNDALSIGDELGISSGQAGYFDSSANVKVLRCVKPDIVEIL